MLSFLLLLPLGKVISRKFDGSPGLVLWIYLRVDYVSVCQGHSDEIVDMCREALEAGLVSHEAMDVDKEECPPPSMF